MARRTENRRRAFEEAGIYNEDGFSIDDSSAIFGQTTSIDYKIADLPSPKEYVQRLQEQLEDFVLHEVSQILGSIRNKLRDPIRNPECSVFVSRYSVVKLVSAVLEEKGWEYTVTESDNFFVIRLCLPKVQVAEPEADDLG